MSDYVVPNDPKVKEKIRKVIGDVVSVMQQIADKRSYITDALKDLKEEHQLHPSIARKMAKTAFKGNYDAVVDEDDAFQIYYENIVRQVATSPTQESDD